MHLPLDLNYNCWTDSQIVLAWIQSEAKRWKTFIANRVSEIQKLTDIKCWSFCPGKDNPADLLTRGMQADELINSNIWFTGPSFLLSENNFAPVIISDQDKAVVIEEQV